MSINTQQKVVPCLWYNLNAEEAVRFYTSVVPNSEITRLLYSPSDTPSGPEGSLLTIDFTLGGNAYLALNGGPDFSFTEAVSLQIHCDDQAEVDRIWSAFCDGGTEVQCGWLKDRWGLSWQIVPKRLTELLFDQDRARARRVMQAMMQMVKIDIATIEQAARGA